MVLFLSTKGGDDQAVSENFEVLIAFALGLFASFIGYFSIPDPCRLFYSGSEACFLSGSGGIESMAILIIGLFFIFVGVADLALRARR